MTAAAARGARSPLRAVAVPTEHGGWGLTLEPVLLGLLVAPGVAGLLLGAAGFTAFVTRTPAKLALGDRRRGRRLARTVLAERVAVAELVALAALVGGAAATASGPFWVPFAIAAPLFGVELWFDVRSRGRRLVPELAGAVGVCSVAPAIALADDKGFALSMGLWLVLGARVVASVPLVREQVARLHDRATNPRIVDVASLAAAAIAALAVAVDGDLLAGAAAILVLVSLQLLIRRRVPPRATVIGIQQLLLGLGVVLATAVGVTA
jgi:hypothetical protein